MDLWSFCKNFKSPFILFKSSGDFELPNYDQLSVEKKEKRQSKVEKVAFYLKKILFLFGFYE